MPTNTKVCFAGAESFEELEVYYYAGVKNVLMSFYYLNKKSPEALEKVMNYARNFEFLIIDSGAFTLMNTTATTQGKHLTKEGFLTFADEYEKFLLKWGKYISVAVELDMYKDKNLYHLVEDVRDRLTATGVPIMPIFHGKLALKRHDERWARSMFKKYKYVGIGSGLVLGKAQNLNPFFSVARKYRGFVHGMGVTTTALIRKGFYYSVDSTTWQGGSRYGAMYQFRGTDMLTLERSRNEPLLKKLTHKLKLFYRGKGKHIPLDKRIDIEKLKKRDNKSMNNLNLLSWVEFANFFRKNKGNKAWWNYTDVPQKKIGRNVGDLNWKQI